MLRSVYGASMSGPSAYTPTKRAPFTRRTSASLGEYQPTKRVPMPARHVEDCRYPLTVQAGSVPYATRQVPAHRSDRVHSPPEVKNHSLNSGVWLESNCRIPSPTETRLFLSSTTTTAIPFTYSTRSGRRGKLAQPLISSSSACRTSMISAYAGMSPKIMFAIAA